MQPCNASREAGADKEKDEVMVRMLATMVCLLDPASFGGC